MREFPRGCIATLCLMLACNEPSSTQETAPESPRSFKIWSADAEAILLEKLGGPYAKENSIPGLYLHRREMSEAQIRALDTWATAASADGLNCTIQGGEIVYKALIFDSEGEKHTYYGTNNSCAEAGPGARFVPLSYFQNFPGQIPYRPEDPGAYSLDRVVIENNVLTLDVRYSDGCATFQNFVLMVDPAGPEGTDINAYLRYRTDNTCTRQSRSRLEIDLSRYNFQNAEFLTIQGWPKRLLLRAGA